jgi:CheY-like chemotaxis protein
LVAEAAPWAREDHSQKYIARSDVEAALSTQREFLAFLSRELRGAANGIQVGADFLRPSAAQPAGDAHEIAELLDASAQRVHELLDALLHATELVRGCGELSPVDVETALLVSDVLQEFRGIARRRAIDLDWQIQDDVPSRVRVDRFQVAAVLRILLDDALRTTVEGSIRVKLSAILDNDAVNSLEVEVSDTRGDHFEVSEGRARADNQEPAINVPMFGHVYAHTIARALGGDISVVESAIGRRAVFRFAAEPIAIEEKRGDEVLMTTDSGAITLARGSRRVLVVDDDAVSRRVLGLRLARAGLCAEFAADGVGAVERASQAEFAAIFLDCDMPGMDGYTAAAQIRSGEASGHRTPIFAVTGWISAEDRRRCHQAGMDEVIAKPVSDDVLSDLLQRWGFADELDVSHLQARTKKNDAASRALLLGASVVGSRLVARLIEREGYQSVSLKDPASALEALRREAFDFVFIDDELGEKQTLDWVAQVRGLSGPRSSLPLVLVAGPLDASHRSDCFAAGIDVILGKPLTQSALIRVLRQWTNGKTAAVGGERRGAA